MKRERAFFRATRFRVDRMHFNKNHVACTTGYSLDFWPKGESVISQAQIDRVRGEAKDAGLPVPPTAAPLTLGKLNSQACEQYNSRLRYIATPCAFMAHETYLQHMLMFMFRWNVCKLCDMFGVTEVGMMAIFDEMPRGPQQWQQLLLRVGRERSEQQQQDRRRQQERQQQRQQQRQRQQERQQQRQQEQQQREQRERHLPPQPPQPKRAKFHCSLFGKM